MTHRKWTIPPPKAQYEISVLKARLDKARADCAAMRQDLKGIVTKNMSDDLESCMESVEKLFERGFEWKKRAEKSESEITVFKESLYQARAEAADCAAMRQALKWMISEESDWDNGEIGVGHRFRNKAGEALSSDAGNKLLERLEKLESRLKDAMEKIESCRNFFNLIEDFISWESNPDIGLAFNKARALLPEREK